MAWQPAAMSVWVLDTMPQIADGNALRPAYDYIVVGAGSAGSVIAAELASSGARVLIVESGGNDDAPTILNPSIWFYNLGSQLDYHLPIQPSPRLNNRTFNMALGHVLGGGSSINGLVWGRGMQRDFDGWAQNGATGWSFEDVLPIFKAQEDWEGGANEWRGAGGPVHVRRPRDPHPAARVFLDAARQMGIPTVEDMNGPMQPGAGYINMNIAKDGTRVSAARAFLRPALNRSNLTLLLNTDVQKVTFLGKRASGIRIIVDGATKDINAEGEVILAAGGVGSPKLLMLSGIGDASDLRRLGIELVENLPGVGKNFQDQVMVLGVVFKYRGKMPERRPDSNGVEAEVYWSSGCSPEETDINIVLHQLSAPTPEVVARFGGVPEDCLTFGAALVKPESRGAVRLVSSNPKDAVLLDVNYFAADSDFKATIRAIELARELGRQAAFSNVSERELIPGPSASASDIEELVRTGTTSFGHPVGGCKIGVDEMAVVDPQLRVHGVDGLRVADSSVMPRIPTGPTNAPTFMVAGKAARQILA
jgi:choline dehydrogenase